MAKTKKPRWLRIIRYYCDCLWYHLLFTLGAEEDDFSKQFQRK